MSGVHYPTRYCACRCLCGRDIDEAEGFLCGPCALAAWKGDARHGNKMEAHR